jgi:beta-ketoacyl-acyl-carrier-protein synthase II
LNLFIIYFELELSMEKIVITGMGTVNPTGLTVKESWDNIINGRSGVGPITLFDASNWQVQIAGEVKDFDPGKYMDSKEARRRDRYEQLAVAAANEAIAQSGINFDSFDRSRVGVIVSSAIGGMKSLQDGIITMKDDGPRRVSPFLIPMLMPNGASGIIAIDHGLHGPAFSVASACASGADGIGTAYYLLQSGLVDVIIAGAAESTICEIGVASFDRIGAMSRRSADQLNTPSPFDKNRDGLVMGEGAGVVVLERESFAKARKAEILAEMAGYGSSADAYHVTAPDAEGKGGSQAILSALSSAGVRPDQVGYVSAHGTGTPLNDAAETQALKRAFGAHAYKMGVSSTKSMTGHMMGATGALEVIYCVNAIRDGILPPTINYSTPDPDCDLDYIPNQARQQKVDVAISNAFGFGGHNAVLAIKRY